MSVGVGAYVRDEVWYGEEMEDPGYMVGWKGMMKAMGHGRVHGGEVSIHEIIKKRNIKWEL